MIELLSDNASVKFDDDAVSLDSNVRVVYFSSVTENTKHFVDKLGFPAERIPLRGKDPFLNVGYPYVLFCPTYGDGDNKKIVPKQVIKFLNDENNRSHCVGVVAGGNRNFGDHYGRAGFVLSARLQVPIMYIFELFGTPHDVDNVRDGLNKQWNDLLAREIELQPV